MVPFPTPCEPVVIADAPQKDIRNAKQGRIRYVHRCHVCMQSSQKLSKDPRNGSRQAHTAFVLSTRIMQGPTFLARMTAVAFLTALAMSAMAAPHVAREYPNRFPIRPTIAIDNGQPVVHSYPDDYSRLP